VTILQPVKQGLSAPVVTSIPQQWSAAWFRSFITNYLQNADVRNAATGSGVDVTSTNFTQPATIGLTPIPDGSVLGSIEPGLNPPQALTKAQLTSLVNIFSRTASGAVPAAPDQDPTLFLNAVGEFVAVPIPPPVAPTSVPFWVPQEDADDNLIIPGPPGKDGINGTGSGGPAVVLLQQEEPEDYMFVPGQIGPKGNTGPTGAPGLNGASLPLVIYPEDPEDPSPPVPGGPGPQGGTGPAGQIGPAGVPMLLYPDDPDDTLVVPGPQGQTGKTGAPGAQFVVYPEDPDDPMPPIPGGPGPIGPQGLIGLQGTTVVLTPDDPDDILHIPGPQGAQGIQGATGASGFAAANWFTDYNEFDESMIGGGAGGVTMFGNPTALVGLTAINGVLTTAMRSDAAPAINQAIVPTWTGLHTFDAGISVSSPYTTTQILLASTGGSAAGGAALNFDTSGNFYITTLYANTVLTVGGYGAGTSVNIVSGGHPTAVAGSNGSFTVNGASGVQSLIINGSSGANGSQPIQVNSGLSLSNTNPDNGEYIVCSNTAATGDTRSLTFGYTSTGCFIRPVNSGNLGALQFLMATGTSTISSTGGWTIAPAASTQGVAVTGNTNAYGIVVNQQTSAGTSFGVAISAGTNTSDIAFAISNAAVTAQYMDVRGDGSVSFYGNTQGGPNTVTLGELISVLGVQVTTNSNSIFNGLVEAAQTPTQLMATSAGGAGSLWVYNPTASSNGYGAYMTFHRGGLYAAYFGLNESNVLSYGGWSAGATTWPIAKGDGGTYAMSIASTATNTYTGAAGPAYSATFSGSGIGLELGGPAATQINAIILQQGSQNQWIVYQPASNTGLHFYSAQDRFVINGVGGVTIPAPSSIAVACTITGFAGAQTLQIQGGTTAGSSYGLAVNAGTNTSDYGFVVQNASGTTSYLQVRGDGQVTMHSGLGVWGAAGQSAQQTGFGTPTGAAVTTNFPGASATLVQCSEMIAVILNAMKTIGFFGT
jgi:collagen type VII alpha